MSVVQHEGRRRRAADGKAAILEKEFLLPAHPCVQGMLGHRILDNAETYHNGLVWDGREMVVARPNVLPDFESPPVVETVLSAQFEPLAWLRTAQLGLLWREYRASFPKTEERPPLDPVIEQFPEAVRPRLGLQLETFDTPPIPRLWYVAEQGEEMIQVQQDRFIKNWRKEEQGEGYPRYATGRAHFDRDFAVFKRFLADNHIPAPRINQCEVTYVNHIVAGEGWSEFGDFERVFNFWRSPAGEIPGSAEDLRMHSRFVIPGQDGTPIGRLHVDVQPARRTVDNRPMYLFHLTARGQIGESLDFFDVGRCWIVKSFASLTSPLMHSIWKRKDNCGD